MSKPTPNIDITNLIIYRKTVGQLENSVSFVSHQTLDAILADKAINVQT